jgi:hypothetical protein
MPWPARPAVPSHLANAPRQTGPETTKPPVLQIAVAEIVPPDLADHAELCA